MNENSKFKLKYDQLRESNPGKKISQSNNTAIEVENTFYDTPGTIRTVCFAWPNGRKQFFNYSYLISGELSIKDEINTVTLRFAADTVTLKGYQLDELFSRLMKQSPCLIIQDDQRYAETKEENDYSLIEISIGTTI